MTDGLELRNEPSPCPLPAYWQRVERAHGFTLVELMIVVVLMALLTTAAALTFARPLRAARWEQVVAQVRNGDESARTVARRFDRETTIVFDLTANTIARREGRDVKWQQPLPRAFHVEQI